MPPSAALGFTNTESSDIEVYVKTGGDPGEVVLVLSRSIGPLSPREVSDEDLEILESEGVLVVLQPSEGGFMSLWVRGSSPWPSSPALGRHLAKELACIVLCDPGPEFPEVDPYSDVFLEINGNDERLVSLY